MYVMNVAPQQKSVIMTLTTMNFIAPSVGLCFEKNLKTMNRIFFILYNNLIEIQSIIYIKLRQITIHIAIRTPPPFADLFSPKKGGSYQIFLYNKAGYGLYRGGFL